MRRHEIENWTLNIISRVEAGQPNEDARVELKAIWPTDIPKVARRIGGHANAARGEDILWIIGVDEKEGVTGADQAEVANWYPKVVAQFDGLSPLMLDHINIDIPTKGVTVVALLFATDRAPFVVKNPVHGTKDGGPVSHEVPWREGTSTRSARRDELLRLLSPLQLLPSFEARDGSFKFRPHENERKHSFHLEIKLYVVPRSQGRIVIPFHRCEASFEIPGCTARIPFNDVHLKHPFWGGFLDTPAKNLSLTIQSTDSEVLIDGPGVVHLSATTTIPPLDDIIYTFYSRDVIIHASLLPVDAEIPISFDMAMHSLRPDEVEDKDIKYKWILQ